LKKYIVTLTAEERQTLSDLIAAGKAAAQKLAHARILLKVDAADGGPAWPDHRIAEAVEVSVATVERVRQRFVEQGLEAALARNDYESTRNGTANLFMISEPQLGWRAVHVTERRTARDFAEVVRGLVEEVHAEAEEVVLVMDNLNTHRLASLHEAFPPGRARRIAERLEVHHTPKHGRWRNTAEITLSVLTRQCPDRRIESAEELRREVAAWEADRNERGVEVRWQFTTAAALVKLHRLYPTTQ
jgi:hypothetical protein